MGSEKENSNHRMPFSKSWPKPYEKQESQVISNNFGSQEESSTIDTHYYQKILRNHSKSHVKVQKEESPNIKCKFSLTFAHLNFLIFN